MLNAPFTKLKLFKILYMVLLKKPRKIKNNPQKLFQQGKIRPKKQKHTLSLTMMDFIKQNYIVSFLPLGSLRPAAEICMANTWSNQNIPVFKQMSKTTCKMEELKELVSLHLLVYNL